MEKRILFISEQHNFLVMAMIKNLEAANFEVVTSQPDIVEIQLKNKLPDIFIVYLEGDLNSFNGTLKYLKKLLAEEGKDRVLYLIGTQIEVSAAYEVIPRTMVSASFMRPVNMTDVLTKLNTLMLDDFESDGRKKILVVDDDGVMLRSMQNWLSKRYDVYIANSGMNAITFLGKKHVDLILLDYEMPVASGLQVFEMLKAEPATASIPVIFLTAKDDRETVMKVLAAKPEKYLLKTMDPEELVESVNNFFKGK
ncbi:MAG: response regulator [Treponema sp.]|nr:response regulator [Treponema sp.]